MPPELAPYILAVVAAAKPLAIIAYILMRCQQPRRRASGRRRR